MTDNVQRQFYVYTLKFEKLHNTIEKNYYFFFNLSNETSSESVKRI